MKKFSKYMSLALVATFGAALAVSCDDSKDNDFVQKYQGGPAVYFSVDENTYFELDSALNTITLPVYRDLAEGELTVDVTVTPLEEYETSDIYTFPTSVTFEAGSKVTQLVIGYDIFKTVIGEEQEYGIQLETAATPFAPNNLVLTMVNPIPWIRIGGPNQNGSYYDYGWGVSETSPGPVAVAVYQQSIDKNAYRISNPYVGYNGDTKSYFEFRVLQQGETFLGQTVTMPDLVGYTLYFITYDSAEDDDMYIAFPGAFSFPISTWKNNRVVEYQENGLPGLIQLAPAYYAYNAGSAYNYPNFDPYIELYFPGFVLLDTEMEVEYLGTLRPNPSQEQVLLNVTLGEDITEARAGVMAGTDVDAVVAAVENGEIPYTSITSSGNVFVDFGTDNETGDYTWVVLAYVGDEVKNVASGKFFYVAANSGYDPNEGWTSLGYVDYTDGYMCSEPFFIFEDDLYLTYQLEIQESDETPGLYRLVNPYGAAYPLNDPGDWNASVTSYLYINATNPNRVFIPASEQTLTWVNMFSLNYCLSYADMLVGNGFTEQDIEDLGFYGSYSDGKITFLPAWLMDDPSTGQEVIMSPLLADWDFLRDQSYSGTYAANLLMDKAAYDATDGEDPYRMNPDGTYFAPFCVDMASLTQTLSRPRQVSLQREGLMPMSLKDQVKSRNRRISQIELFRNLKKFKVKGKQSSVPAQGLLNVK